MSFFEVRDVVKTFGGLRAVDGVSFSVNQGEVFAVVGPNGSGKTTLFNIISGIYRPDSGQVLMNGRNLAGQSPYVVGRAGVGRIFQHPMLFDGLSVVDNVMVGRHCRRHTNLAQAVLGLSTWRTEEQVTEEEAMELLMCAGLSEKADELAANLSYGEQKRLEIARALATDPRIVLLDEPAAGTSTGEMQALSELIQDILSRGITILLVEHKMDFVMGISNRVHVLNFGKTIAEGIPSEVCSHPDVIMAYLGKEVRSLNA